jgi:hypothetical protein
VQRPAGRPVEKLHPAIIADQPIIVPRPLELGLERFKRPAQLLVTVCFDPLGHTTREAQPLLNAISRLEREISLLREYRTRLVADVVTGKLDVRGVTLPAESEPTAALEAETIEQDSSEPEEAENPSG